jgi:hypothetical protein
LTLGNSGIAIENSFLAERYNYVTATASNIDFFRPLLLSADSIFDTSLALSMSVQLGQGSSLPINSPFSFPTASLVTSKSIMAGVHDWL